MLIAYQKLAELAGVENYNEFQDVHRKLVNEALLNGNNNRQPQWTESIAVGSKSYIEKIKEKLGALAKGRKILEKDEGFQLREEAGTYIANYDSKNGNIGPENAYYWDINP